MYTIKIVQFDVCLFFFLFSECEALSLNPRVGHSQQCFPKFSGTSVSLRDAGIGLSTFPTPWFA